MPFYESVVVTRQDITRNQCDKIIEEFNTLIKSQGGSIKTNEYWGLKNLAYEINKNKKGHYAMTIIESNAETIAEYERKLKLHEDIIRYMTIKIKNFDEKPSIMFLNSAENSKEAIK